MRNVSSDNQIWCISQFISDSLNSIGANVRIASFITTAAKIELMKKIEELGYNNILYCDTDSIMVHISALIDFTQDIKP